MSKSMDKRILSQKGLPILSDIYQIECKECEGSGLVTVMVKPPKWAAADSKLPSKRKCPTCKGSGGFNLVVDFCPHDKKDCIDPTSCHEPMISSDDGSTIEHCEYLCSRPLTVAEVGECTTRGGIIISNALHADNVLSHAKEGKAYYKGQPVRLVPKGGGDEKATRQT